MRHRRRDAGFTLIELLVVIVILGIISGVVVFAVRGSGDKGKQAAIDTEARIIRTAEEAFCAREGRYAKIPELIEKKYLSSEPGYHGVDVDYANGPCNGSAFRLTTEGAPADSTCGATWCTAETPFAKQGYDPFYPGLAQVGSGKVLAVNTRPEFLAPSEYCDPQRGCAGFGRRSKLYDPETGQWNDAATLPQDPRDRSDQQMADALLVPITGTAATCGSNCGNVLALVGGTGDECYPCGGRWWVYDESDGPGGSWKRVPLKAGNGYEYDKTRRPYSTIIQLTTAAQITGPNCGGNCGKVLIVGQFKAGGHPPSRPVAELYNPKTNEIEEGRSYADLTTYVQSPALAELHNGTVLVVGSVSGTAAIVPWSATFDPSTGEFGDAATPTYRHKGLLNPLAVLPNGNVLAIADMGWGATEGKAEVFVPGTGWRDVPSCGIGCYILTSLADGRVLANASTDPDDRVKGNSVAAFLFDHKKTSADHPYGQWVKTDDMNNWITPGRGLLLDGGACAGARTRCRQAYVYGQYCRSGHPCTISAELFTTPS